MRSLWLASAAFIVISGTAFAQTNPSPGMANPGYQSQGTMSQPGTMGNPNQGTMSQPGTMGNPNQGTMSQPGTMGNPNQGAMAEPSAGYDTAARYLQRARTAIQQHRRAQADTLLSNAETIMLTRAVPQSSGPTPDTSPRVTAISNARAAVQQRNWTSALQYTDEAIQHHGAMNPNGAGQGAMSPNGTSPAQPNGTVQ
ncbi:MAG TPA: hypothetical protein VL356_14235 [Acidocella sp.]|jgi:hypothetical protein|nr:hypothetical protein [Acidocella sp.]